MIGVNRIRAFIAEPIVQLRRGNADLHDELIAQAGAGFTDCDVLMLAQFSMARAASRFASLPGRRVLTSPGSAVSRLKRDLAQVAVAVRPTMATRLLGVADGLGTRTDRRLNPTYQGICDSVAAEASTRLGNAAFAAEWAAGKAMHLDDAVACALDLSSEVRNDLALSLTVPRPLRRPAGRRTDRCG